jgi:sec-independent protein translocase protein TatA
MGLFGLGVPELALVAGAAALLFGPAKIPQLGQALGKTAKSVKAAADEFQKELQSTEADGADATGNATQKLKEKHPAAGEGEDVRGVE